MRPRILFTTVPAPVPRIGEFAATDQMAYRLTRGQELFTLYLHTHSSPLHLLAQNLAEPSVVLEQPPPEALREELRRGYEYVAITFDALNGERLLELVDMVRECSPRSRVVVGGYGAVCASELFRADRWEGQVDHLCHGHGVPFLQGLLRSPLPGPLRCRLPKEGSTLPWLNPRPFGTIGIILAGLGCTQRCPFCSTSAATDGGYIEVMNAAQIAQTMRDYWERTPATNSVTIYDENFLDHFDKVRELGQHLVNDDKRGLREYNFAAFGSLAALSRFDPDELLLTGLDTVWVGVESKFSSLRKTRDRSAQELVPFLHSIGIKTIGSWILGQDCQTPDNIEEDIDYFVSLDPCFQQLSLLTVIPGTPLFRAYQRQGRIPDELPWDQYHLYGDNHRGRHFTHADRLRLVDRTYRRIYEEHGPALMKVLEVNLNGYEYTVRSCHPVLREQRSAFFRERCRSYWPLLRAARVLAPTPAVASRLELIDLRYRELIGEPSATEEMVADGILRRAAAEIRRRQTQPPPTYRPEPFRRYTYAAVASRPAGKPYQVEYPALTSDRNPAGPATVAGPRGCEPPSAETGEQHVLAT